MKIMMIVLVCMVMQNSLHGMEESNRSFLSKHVVPTVLQQSSVTVEDKKKVKAMLLAYQKCIDEAFDKAGLYNTFLSDDDWMSVESLSQEKK